MCPGGIGKTSIALAVLHDPRVMAMYGDRRCFLSCEAITTIDAVVRALAEASGLILERDLSSEIARQYLISYLQKSSGIICLDNLETPLESDQPAVEALLNEIASLRSVALLITSRDTSIPTIKWTSPPLAHIAPFSREAALSAWDEICHLNDEYVIKLVDAVDCMLLAVTLLARLVAVEGNTHTIWTRWETEYTDLIRTGGKDHRLYSVAESIELSLRALSDTKALMIFGLICLLPVGISDSELSKLSEAFLMDRQASSQAIVTLKQLSLIHAEVSERDPKTHAIRVLSPVRHYIQQHRVPDALFLLSFDVVIHNGDIWDVGALVSFGMTREGPCRERCLELVIAIPGLTNDVDVLYQALEKSRRLKLGRQSGLLRALGHVFSVYRSDYESARSVFAEAIVIDEQLEDRKALFEDWRRWIETVTRIRDDEHERMDDVQKAILKCWEFGCDENRMWTGNYRVYDSLAHAQHLVNIGRRKRNLPIIHRSGLYADVNRETR